MIFKNNDDKLKKQCKISETDKFWDIDQITPAKKPTKTNGSISMSDKVILTSVFGKDEEKSGIAPQPINRPEQSKELIFSYSPDNSLIQTVEIFSWPLKYTFYERFRFDAKKYFDYTHTEVQPIRYYSYMPGYMQMSARQRDWYFYWRSCVRNKKYLPTDSSYILLYIYEILNLPEFIPAEKGIELLCDIWENYRESYTKLDKYLSEWICDYCLMYNIKLPVERLNFLPDVIEVSAFKQFYAHADKGEEFALLLLEKTSSYRWRKSKYITCENRDVFEKYVKNAFAYAIKQYAIFDGRFDGKNRLETKKTIRDSFGGALCAYDVKRKIELTYFDLANVNDISFIVTDTVRYCENRIRAYLGIRARLSIQNLTEQHKKILDQYFDEYLPAPFFEKKRKRADEFEDFYSEEENKPFSVSFEKAKEIEEKSWEVTDKLVVDDFEDDFVLPDVEQNEAVEENEKPSEKSIEGESLDIAKLALICVFKKDKGGFEQIAEEAFMLPETLAECVNELCYEVIGDIGIEEKDGEYVIIPDYEQEIGQWLKL